MTSAPHSEGRQFDPGQVYDNFKLLEYIAVIDVTGLD